MRPLVLRPVPIAHIRASGVRLGLGPDSRGFRLMDLWGPGPGRASGWAAGTTLSRHSWAGLLEAAFSLTGLEAPQGPPRLAPAWDVTARKRPRDGQEASLWASC